MTSTRRIALTAVLGLGSALALTGAAWWSVTGDISTAVSPAAAPAPTAGSWRTDPAWNAGKAEWALYDAVRPIYGKERRYEATIFTNVQRMDPVTTTKAEDWRRPGLIAVFKHNVSELIPTENYTYRFLTTCFVRSETMAPYKLVFSSQEDCGSTYKRIVVGDVNVEAGQFCYFPGSGAAGVEYPRPRNLAFHDALSLTLRDFPFDAEPKPAPALTLVPDQTDTHETSLRGAAARVTYLGRETVTVPYGAVDVHHLRVDHEPHGGVSASHYWFAADPALRHVMVRYEGPFGVRYELKRLAWWAYWDRNERRPE